MNGQRAGTDEETKQTERTAPPAGRQKRKGKVLGYRSGQVRSGQAQARQPCTPPGLLLALSDLQYLQPAFLLTARGVKGGGTQVVQEGFYAEIDLVESWSKRVLAEDPLKAVLVDFADRQGCSSR